VTLPVVPIVLFVLFFLLVALGNVALGYVSYRMIRKRRRAT
jgi:hypothetical protein